MTNTELIRVIETLILDKTKELEIVYFDTAGKWKRNLSMMNYSVFERIYNGATGNFGYYGVSFFLEGCTDKAFYKSLNGSFYHIESRNDIPIFYCKIE